MAGLISGLVDAGLLGSAEAKQRLREASWDQILPAIHRGIITSGITILYQGAYSPTREVNEIPAADKTLRADGERSSTDGCGPGQLAGPTPIRWSGVTA